MNPYDWSRLFSLLLSILQAASSAKARRERMNPHGMTPPEAARSTHRDSLLSGRRGMTTREKLFGVALAGIIGVIYTSGILGRQDNQDANMAVAASSHQAVASAPVLPHVRLKTGANVRSGPSRNAGVLRIGQQGEAFTKFGETNGWLHVGANRPEGWVAQSVVIPAD